MEKRSHPRFRTRFQFLVSEGNSEGVGFLVNISYSGARLEGTILRPEPGTKVRLHIYLLPTHAIELVGEVVRVEGSGFAVAYQAEDPEVQRLVDDVAALVCP